MLELCGRIDVDKCFGLLFLPELGMSQLFDSVKKKKKKKAGLRNVKML